LYGLEAWSDLPHASSLCGACKDVCPVQIDLPRLLLRLRAEASRKGLAPLWLKLGMALYGAIATRPLAFRVAAGVASRLMRLVSRDGWVSRLPGPLGAWTSSRDFPTLATRPFTQQWRAKSAHEKEAL
jgi:L-lactate dehydrogenase complex protein LldF